MFNNFYSTGRTDLVDLRDRREALGLSRTRLAVIVGFSPAYIAQLEDGYRPRRGDAVARISTALDGLNDDAPGAQAGREVTTSAGVGDGHAAY